MEQKEEKKWATEGELTILSENHSFQNHTYQHQQTTGTIIRAQTLTQKGFPWVTTLKFHSEQLECQWEMCIKILLDQADWAVLQDKMSFFFFCTVFFCSITFMLSLLNSTWHTSALLNILSSAPFALFHSCPAGMCRHSSPKSLSASLSHVAGIIFLSSHRRSWSF